MKTKIKKIAYGISSAALFFPAIALAAPAGNGFQAPSGTGLSNRSITDIVGTFMNWLLIMVGIISVIAFAISGIMYLTSAGDEERNKKAKSAMIMSIIGVVVALLGLVILTAVSTLLTANNASI